MELITVKRLLGVGAFVLALLALLSVLPFQITIGISVILVAVACIL